MSMFGSTNILQLQEHWTEDQTTYFWEKLMMKEEEEEAPSLGSDKAAGEHEVFSRQGAGFGSLIAVVISWGQPGKAEPVGA